MVEVTGNEAQDRYGDVKSAMLIWQLSWLRKTMKAMGKIVNYIGVTSWCALWCSVCSVTEPHRSSRARFPGLALAKSWPEAHPWPFGWLSSRWPRPPRAR